MLILDKLMFDQTFVLFIILKWWNGNRAFVFISNVFVNQRNHNPLKGDNIFIPSLNLITQILETQGSNKMC